MRMRTILVLGPALAEARRGLRARRRRALLTALGIAVGLGLGFDRAARAAGLPDIIVRFDSRSAGVVGQRINALPDLAAYATRFEQTNAGIDFAGRDRDDAVAEVVGSGRRGYAVVS